MPAMSDWVDGTDGLSFGVPGDGWLAGNVSTYDENQYVIAHQPPGSIVHGTDGEDCTEHWNGQRWVAQVVGSAAEQQNGSRSHVSDIAFPSGGEPYILLTSGRCGGGVARRGRRSRVPSRWSATWCPGPIWAPTLRAMSGSAEVRHQDSQPRPVGTAAHGRSLTRRGRCPLTPTAWSRNRLGSAASACCHPATSGLPSRHGQEGQPQISISLITLSTGTARMACRGQPGPGIGRDIC
jgi:hypothetical protein